MDNVDFDIFKPTNNLPLKKGRLLISEPLSNDDFFNRSVVLLTEYSQKEATGFILNKPSEYKLSDVFNTDFKFNPILNYGGPVGANTLHFIHKITDGIPNSVEISPGLYWGGDFEKIKDKIKVGTITDSDIRFFIGYSGWSENQLDEEVKNKFWLVTECVDNVAMDFKHKKGWEKLLNSFGNKYRHWANVPENPSLN